MRPDSLEDGCDHTFQSKSDHLSTFLDARSELPYRTKIDFNSLRERRVYRRRKFVSAKSTLHWGQRKLLLSEIDFLRKSCERTPNDRRLVVYAGAGPGDHLPLLICLFKDEIDAWEFFYPRPMSWRNNLENVTIHETEFNDHLITSLLEKYSEWEIFLISDIRTADYTSLRYVSF